MRRIMGILIMLCLVLCLSIPAQAAAAAATSASFLGTVSSDGSCQLTLTATIQLDQPVEDLTFPLPEGASNVTLNGSRARGRVENGVRHMDISGVAGKTAGVFTLTFTYTLRDLVSENETGLLELKLPLLSGFAYPVRELDFTITLPGPVDAKPAFSSGYHQANIEKDLTFSVTAATVKGSARTELKDHETLVMTLAVPEEMFPQNRIEPPDLRTGTNLALLAVGIALVYWLAFLRNLPPFFFSRPTPPEGYNAGELPGVLHLAGSDLSMMVFSWAQLGYLTMEMERSGRVLLHKSMEMGNERSVHERKYFNQLFRKRSVLDTGGLYYAELCRAVRRGKPNVAFLVHPKSGNIYVFRALAAAAGLFCGVTLGIGLSAGAAMQWFWAVVVGIVVFCGSWYIQSWGEVLFAMEKRRLWISVLLGGVFLLLSAMAGNFSLGLYLVLGQFLAGLLTAFGGRRTVAGKQAMAETMGFRRYLKTVSAGQLQEICKKNPDYFHQMAPYALALGVDRRFAEKFGKTPQNSCPYLVLGVESSMRASQWRGVMRRAAQAMNARQQRSFRERLSQIIVSFLK